MDGMSTSINAILKNLIKNFNTLLDCPVRFSGVYNEEKVHCFVEYIEYYKRIKCITDEQALHELQYLLLDQAHTWWLRRKSNINTWSEALTILENQYSRKRPANVVYTEILKHHYEDYECEDDFIDDKVELFYELSEPKLEEKNKLEIIYALLPIDIQNKIKLVHVTGIKELKEQVKLAKLGRIDTSSNRASKSSTTLETTTNLSEVPNQEESSNESNFQEKDNQISVINISPEIDNNTDTERDPIIKIRRTEDLMPPDIKEEDEEEPMPTEEFLPNVAEPLATVDISDDSPNNFQIDTDIMNQINNILDESERNMSPLSNNEDVSTITPQLSNTVACVDHTGLDIKASKQSSKSQDNLSKTQVKKTKKLKRRCTYCRHFNHTTQICLKKSKHMRLSAETETTEISNITPQVGINEVATETLPFNVSKSNVSITSPQPADTLLSIPVILNRIPTTSKPLADTSTAVTNSVILNNISEKCISPMMTTKLIAPINGKTPNKILAAKLRSLNTPSPKCHQCGTLGFYKSICPNCSPIYNNNNHNQYSK